MTIGQLAPGVAFNGEEVVTGAWTVPMQGVPKSAAVPKGRPSSGKKPAVPAEPPCTAFCTINEQILPEEPGWAPVRQMRKPADKSAAKKKPPGGRKLAGLGPVEHGEDEGVERVPAVLPVGDGGKPLYGVTYSWRRAEECDGTKR
jgi:hypothetical protein